MLGIEYEKFKVEKEEQAEREFNLRLKVKTNP